MKSLPTVLTGIIVIFLVGLSASSYYLYTQVKSQGEQISSLVDSSGGVPVSPPVSTSGCGKECQNLISEEVSQAMATMSGSEPTKVIEKVTTVESAPQSPQTSFITMGETSTTTSTGWETIEDSATYIDLANDFGGQAYVTFSASLKVAHGNGKAFARLYDATHGIAVDGSEISTVDNMDFEKVTTGNLPLWRGNNLYKVQIKSLNSFQVTYSGGKIKIVY